MIIHEKNIKESCENKMNIRRMIYVHIIHIKRQIINWRYS